MRLRVAARTDIGRVRELNEDMFLVQPEHGLCVVCDGMGGCPAGEVASQMAVDTIREHVSASDLALVPRSNGYMQRTTLLAAAVQRSNAFIYDQGRRDPEQARMGTTMVGIWLADHVASVAHVGDSRAYLWRDEALEPLTRDHSLVEAQVEAGLLDREQALASEQQNVLLRVVGREPDVEVELSEVPVQPGDYLLLCSDGLTRTVPEPMMAQTIVRLGDPQRICDSLIDAANRNGGPDNITVVVVEVVDRWWRRLWNQSRRQFGGGYDAETHPAV